MNPWVKRKWVKALRSGEYTQGQSSFYERWEYGEEHCCLAVLLAEMKPDAYVTQKD